MNEKAGIAMHNDRYGRTPDEVKDESRHSYAKGTVALRDIADRLSAITLEGKPINRWDLERLHRQLYEVYELLGSETVFRMGVEPATDAEEAALDAYCDTYSDGTPVSILVQPPNIKGWSARGEIYEGGIPWLPKMTGTLGYLPSGPLPPGCEVIVVDPPNGRKSKAHAAWQDGDTDVEALKTPCAKRKGHHDSVHH